VAAITGAYLLGYVFAGSKYKADIQRTFSAIGHGLFIPLFFVAIGLTSNFRALGGHWMLFNVIFVVAVVSKLVGCGMAALARGMGVVPSLRIGCGMVSRGEVGLIVAAMAAKSGVFTDPEVAMIVATVLLTTVITPIALRGAFQLRCPQDDHDLPPRLEDQIDFLAHEASFGDDDSYREPHNSRDSVYSLDVPGISRSLLG
jgi:Kef-type K+ transport system membrane component KefB